MQANHKLINCLKLIFRQEKSLFLVGVIILFLLSGAYSQNVISIQGTVVDAKDGSPMPFATVMLKRAVKSTTTDTSGVFRISHQGLLLDTLVVTFVGYETYKKPVFAGQKIKLTIKLEPKNFESQGVIISAKKERYTRKNNPAVELIEKVIAHKAQNRLEKNDYYQYDQHEITQLAVNNLSDSLSTLTKFLFFFGFQKKYLDISDLNGRPILPVYINENIFTKYYRKSPESQKTAYRANKTIYVHRMVDMTGMQNSIKQVFDNINVYDNNVRLFSDDFMSPLSPLSPSFYKFFIMDTLEQNGIRCIDLTFMPRNPSDFGFFGSMLITCDTNYAVKRLELRLPPNTGVNFVDELRIVQEYDYIQGNWCLIKDEAVADLSFFLKNFASSHIRRSNVYSDYVFNNPQPDTLYKASDKQLNTTSKTANYTDKEWDDSLRLRPLRPIESNTYQLYDDLHHDYRFKIMMNTIMTLTTTYIPAGKIDFGPWDGIISYNSIEGLRSRVGFRTTTLLNKRIFFNGYAAYGFGDQTWKYQGAVRYSFVDKKNFPAEYPRNAVVFNYQYDYKMPGQSNVFGNLTDRFWQSFLTTGIDKMTADRMFALRYEYDVSPRFYTELTFENLEQRGLGEMNFNTINKKNNLLITSQLFVKLRYSHEIKYFESSEARTPINSTHPVWTLTYNVGFKDFLGGEYGFHRLDLEFTKLTLLSSYGYLKTIFNAGKVWNPVPYPLLFVHPGNQSYFFKTQSFNLMNVMEFVSDEYVSAQISYMSYGLIFNRIPLLKRLRWRECFGVKSVWGNISPSNLPRNNPDLMLFPESTNNLATDYSLAARPYLEASIGIYNIFTVGRIEFVHRFDYLDRPDVMKWGIRIGALIGF